MLLPSSLRHPPHFRPSGHKPSSDDTGDSLDCHSHTVRQPIGEAQRLRDAKHGSTELAKRRSLPGQAIDFCPDRRRQSRVRCASAKCAELMFEVLLGLRRDISTSPFPLEVGYELSGHTHRPSIRETAGAASSLGRSRSPKYQAAAEPPCSLRLDYGPDWAYPQIIRESARLRDPLIIQAAAQRSHPVRASPAASIGCADGPPRGACHRHPGRLDPISPVRSSRVPRGRRTWTIPTAAHPPMTLGAGLRGRQPSLACRSSGWTIPSDRKLGRRRPRRRRLEYIVRHDQPSLAHRVCAGQFEVGHLPVTDLGGFRKIVQGQRRADPASLAVHDDFQQPSAEHPRCLFAGTFPNDPWAIGDPLFDVFSYVSVDNGRGCYWPEGRAQRLPLANRLVTIRETFPASVWP